MYVQKIGTNPQKDNNKNKMCVAISTIIGTATSLLAIRKYRGTKKLILNNFNEIEVATIAIGSICGGLLGGIISDYKNTKAKIKEGIVQFFGDTLIPLLCVSSAIRLYKKVTGKEKSNMLLAVGTSSLFAGIYAGNRVCNLLNEKLFNKKQNRGIKAIDFAPHVDDTCVALSLIFNNNSIGNSVSKVVPLALTLGGYATGTAKENDN